MDNIYFTSDLHFGHDAMLALRPFFSITEMNKILISNWNEVVGTSGIVYILKDITMEENPNIVYGFLSQLNGRKVLVRGNHDRITQDNFDKKYLEEVVEYLELYYLGQRFVLSHYPLIDWNGKYKGAISLYGHIHSYSWDTLSKINGRSYDVGVDANFYAPVCINEIINKCEIITHLGESTNLIHERKSKDKWLIEKQV